jgi:hypothetical protein
MQAKKTARGTTTTTLLAANGKWSMVAVPWPDQAAAGRRNQYAAAEASTWIGSLRRI